MTLHCKKTGATTRAKAEKAARKAADARGFPPWRCLGVERTTIAPDLCLVIGEVT